MDNFYLQIIDPAPEQAEEINSLLRNSGINVRILHADNTADAERQIREFQPALVIYHPACSDSIPVTRIGEAARRSGVFMAVRFAADDPGVFLQALSETACIGLDRSENDRLVDLVRQLSGAGRTSLDLNAARDKHDELQERYELLLDSTAEAVAYLHEGLHVFANSAYLEALQVRDFSELESISLLDLVHSGNTDFKALIRNISKGSFPAEALPAQVRGPAGNEFEAQLLFKPVKFNGEPCAQMVIRKSESEADLLRELDHLRSIDPLSGMHHRRFYLEQLEDGLNNMDEKGDGAVFYLEPDGIGALVESWSISELDHYIAQLSREIQSHLEDADLSARIGECSFGIFAMRDHNGLLRQLGEAIRAGVELMPQGQRGVEQPVSCSIGMAKLGPQIGSAEEALSQARSACHQAAKEGNTLLRYRPTREVQVGGDEDAQWAERLKFALNNDDFYSVQNAIVNLEGETEGLFENRTYLHEEDEAHDLELEAFGPPADRVNLASTIDRQVIPGLLRVISGTGDRHFINISGNSVLDFSFSSWFQRQLQEYDVEGSQLVLQVSVDTAHANLRATRRMFEELASLGCGFSVSHFDDCKRSIELVEKLNLTFVKLPPGLSTDLSANQSNQNIIRNVAGVAAIAGVQVFADEVNNSADMALLWQCGVKLVSGEFLQEEPKVIGQ